MELSILVAVTMAVEMLHDGWLSCNIHMCIHDHDSPDMCARGPLGLWASGMHIRQIPHAHVTNISYIHIHYSILIIACLSFNINLTFF